jgi:hypothetical protein
VLQPPLPNWKMQHSVQEELQTSADVVKGDARKRRGPMRDKEEPSFRIPDQKLTSQVRMDFESTDTFRPSPPTRSETWR